MKEFCQKAKLVLSLEKDDKKNLTSMQLRVWKVNQGTTILVRVFKDTAHSENVLWNGERTISEVYDFILNLLKSLDVILDTGNWEYSNQNDCFLQDEYEEKEKCVYFSWNVKPYLLCF